MRVTRGPGLRVVAAATGLLVALTLLSLPSTTRASGSPAVAAPGPDRVRVAALRGADATALAAGELVATGSASLGGGDLAVRLQQSRDGVPVYAGELVVVLDAAGRTASVTGEVTTSTVAPAVTVSGSAARTIALAAAAALRPRERSTLVAAAPTRYLYDPALVGGKGTRVRTVWRVGVTGPAAGGLALEVLVDATTGSVVSALDLTTRLARSICDGVDDPGSHLADGGWCTSADPDGYYLPVVDATNPIALKAYDDLGNAAAFYADVLGVDLTSLVGLDTERPYAQRLTPELTATVRFCDRHELCPYKNAGWTDADPFFVPARGRTYPGGQLFLGDGFEQALDVTAHELTHGVTSATNGLRYAGQSGAINESMSDVFGELSQLYDPVARTFVDARDPRWLVGEKLTVIGGAVRSMSAPPRWLPAGGGQPDRMTSPRWASGSGDAGGVHTNSGVGNKTAYLIARGGTFRGVTVRGIGDQAAARIYWRTQQLLTAGSNYRDLAEDLSLACSALYGGSSGTCSSVRRATAATGIASSQVSMTVSSTRVRPGRTVKIKAQLRGARGGELTIARSRLPTLVLTRRYLGTKSWVKVRSQRSTVHGKVTWRVPVKRSAVYKVRYAGSAARGLTATTKSRVVRTR